MSEQSGLCSDAAWTVKKDIFVSAEKAAHRTAFQTGARQQRGRFGTEMRQNEGEVTSAKKPPRTTWRPRRRGAAGGIRTHVRLPAN